MADTRSIVIQLQLRGRPGSLLETPDAMQAALEQTFAAGQKNLNLSDEEMSRVRAELDRQFSVPLPTPFQSRGPYAIVKGLWDEVHAYAEKAEQQIADFPILATADVGIVNGCALKGSDGKIAIVLDDALLMFANMLTKYAADVMSEQSKKDGFMYSTDAKVVGRQARQKRTRDLLIDLFDAYVLESSPSDSKPYFPSAHVAALGSYLRHAVEIFVMGHEYGHCYHGHLDEARALRFGFPDSADAQGEDVGVVFRSLKQEIQADIFGMQAALYSMNESRMPVVISTFGVGFFFAALSTVTDIVAFLTDIRAKNLQVGVEESQFRQAGGSHPPARVRVALLAQAAANSDFPVDLKREILQGFERGIQCWDAVAPVLYDHYRNQKRAHARPHPRWLYRVLPNAA
jgi:hypothetical protein